MSDYLPSYSSDSESESISMKKLKKEPSVNEPPNSHSEFILNGLQALKKNNILCDVILIAEEKSFHVHKIVLASVSDYFRSMFTSGMRESSQSKIELKGVSSRGLEKVIQIIYTSQAEFETYTDIFDVISAANHLQCLVVIGYCERNLLSRLTFNNFNYFIQVAKFYDLPNALKQIEIFIVDNFAQIINQLEAANNSNRKLALKANNCDDFENGHKNLSYDQILSCLKQDSLKIKEIDLFVLTWKWINKYLLVTKGLREAVNNRENKLSNTRARVHPWMGKSAYIKNKYHSKFNRAVVQKPTGPQRKVGFNFGRVQKFKKPNNELNKRITTESNSLKIIDMIRNLMSCIRFALISPADIINRVQTMNNLMLNDGCLRKMVVNALNYHLMPNTYLPIRQPVKRVFSRSNIGRRPWMNLNIRSPVKCVLTIGGREINPNPSLHDSCFILNDFIDSSPPMSTGLKTNNIQKTNLTSLPISLSHMQTVVVDNFLYILGGCLSQCAHGESAVNNTFCFDPRVCKWTSMTPMLEKRAYFYACSLATRDNLNLKKQEFIIAFGGKNQEGALSSVEKFNMAKNEWSFVQSMPSTYYAHSGACLNDVAYLSGGYSNGNFTSDLHSYSIEKNQWTFLKPMNVARGWHSMCAIDNKLFVFGGCILSHPGSFNQETINQHQMAQPVTVTEFYTPGVDQWTIVKPIINMHKEACHFVRGNYVYIFGGYNIVAKTGQKLVSRYDTVSDLWQTIGQMADGMTGVGCCCIDLPWFVLEDTNCSQKKNIRCLAEADHHEVNQLN